MHMMGTTFQKAMRSTRDGGNNRQIWIVQGQRPSPCNDVIGSAKVEQRPQYGACISNWKTEADQVAEKFTVENDTGAKKISLESLPGHFALEGAL
jgi:hypothetical protein